MRGVNETIARMANAEENCKGRFWEGRFKSQALLDEAALLSCMAYVDLNPIRAGMEDDVLPQAPLMPFDGSSHVSIHNALPFTAADYIALVDSTGRVVREDKRGAIDPKLAALVSRVGIDPEQWLEHVKHFGRRYGYCAGEPKTMQAFAERFQLFWCKGVAASMQVYVN